MNKLNIEMRIIIGMANANTGRIKLLILKPELNQITISESLYQRDSVMSTDKNKLKDSSIGRNLIKLNPNIVVMASFGNTQFAAIRKNSVVIVSLSAFMNHIFYQMLHWRLMRLLLDILPAFLSVVIWMEN